MQFVLEKLTISLFLLTRLVQDFLVDSFRMVSMLVAKWRSVFLLTFALAALAACTFDVEGVKKSADELKKSAEASRLKDCKDEDGKLLPEWICRKDSGKEND